MLNNKNRMATTSHLYTIPQDVRHTMSDPTAAESFGSAARDVYNSDNSGIRQGRISAGPSRTLNEVETPTDSGLYQQAERELERYRIQAQTPGTWRSFSAPTEIR